MDKNIIEMEGDIMTFIIAVTEAEMNSQITREFSKELILEALVKYRDYLFKLWEV